MLYETASGVTPALRMLRSHAAASDGGAFREVPISAAKVTWPGATSSMNDGEL